jgi:hypothetical protein
VTWKRRFGRSLACIVLGGVIGVAPARPALAEFVDLELLLAMDASASIDMQEYFLQVQALADAFRDPDVISAIRISAPSGVAIALMQWAGPTEQVYAVPWSLVVDEATASILASQIEKVPRSPTLGGTAIGDALLAGISLLSENNFQGMRHVIDVSGDGRATKGTSPGPVRSYAVSLGMTINGLAILNEEPNLASYYQERVIGGAGAFVMEANDFEDFKRAIRMKLIREIVGTLVADASPDEEPTDRQEVAKALKLGRSPAFPGHH